MLLLLNSAERKIMTSFLVTLLAGHSFENNFILKAVNSFTLNMLHIPIALDCLICSYHYVRISFFFFLYNGNHYWFP